jgi:23S rRNA (adenine2503-C2)-methyltransferase
MNEIMKKKDIKSLNLIELTEEMKQIGEKSFRAKQIYDWIHVKLADSFSEMNNLPNHYEKP